MVDRPDARGIFVLRTLIVLLLAFLGWRAFTLGMADASATSAPMEALQWRSDQPAALFTLSEQQVKNPETHISARDNAQRSLRTYPFNGRAYRVLAQITEAEKNPALAYELFQKAEAYSPRDLETRAALLNHALLGGRIESAVYQLDMLLRLQPDLQAQLMPVIGELAAIPAAHDPLILALSKNPPWRLHSVKSLMVQEKAAERYAVFVDRLTQSEGGISDAEQQAWLVALNQGKQWSLAYLSWALNLPPEFQKELGNIFNGSFENELLGSEFDWQFQPVPGASMDRSFRQGVKGEKALRVQFGDRRVLFNHVRQTLVLTAGSYRFSGMGLTENLVNERGLVWEIQCLGGGPNLAVSEPWQGNSKQWQPFTIDFEVPSASCEAQSLTLKLPARVPAEQQVSGAIWFDDLRVQRIQRLTQPSVQKNNQ